MTSGESAVCAVLGLSIVVRVAVISLDGLVLLGGLALLGWIAAEVWIHLHLQRLCVQTKHSWTAPRDGVRWCRVCGKRETGR